MKNKAAIRLAAITLAAFAACVDPTQGELGPFCPESHFLFELVDGETAVRITWYVGGGTDVRIPPYIRGLPVTEIWHWAFTDKLWEDRHEEWVFRNLTSVTIPSSVTRIGNFAFADNHLTSVAIPPGVATIEHAAFGGNKLTIVTIPDSVVHIEMWAFAENRLASITIGGDVAIEESAPGLYDRFGDSFARFYESQGRMAGTYTYSDGEWTFQPR